MYYNMSHEQCNHQVDGNLSPVLTDQSARGGINPSCLGPFQTRQTFILLVRANCSIICSRHRNAQSNPFDTFDAILGGLPLLYHPLCNKGCLAHDVWCIVFGAWCSARGVWCMVFGA